MKVKEFIEKYHDKYYEYYIAIYMEKNQNNLKPNYIGEFSHKLSYMRYWDYDVISSEQTPTRINLILKGKNHEA